ncbi:hypothetical protein R6Q57_030041 [Mikania cordata]
MAKTYGPLIWLQLGSTPVVIVSSADAAREIMKTHDIIFSNRPFTSVIDKIFYGSKDVVFSPYGEYWRKLKSICVLHLLSSKQVQLYRQVREDETAQIIRKIQEANGSVVNMTDLLVSLTNNLIARVAFGKTYGYEHMVHRIANATARFSVGNYFTSFTWMDRLSGLHREADEIFKESDDIFEGVIEEHVNKKDFGIKGHDLVDILLEIQKDKSTGFELERYMMKAIILNVFGAGTDTTSTSLVWAIGELLRNTRVMKELQQEARKIGRGRPMIPEEDVEKMPYLKAVFKEGLRLHVPVPLLVPRESTQDVKIFGYDIPSGTQVWINAWSIARDPSIWEEPDVFRPERFLNSPIDYIGSHFEFLPFGAGRRGCPGIKFAATINELVLANLVYKFEFALEGEHSLDMSETDGMTAHKKYPILVKATLYE